MSSRKNRKLEKRNKKEKALGHSSYMTNSSSSSSSGESFKSSSRESSDSSSLSSSDEDSAFANDGNTFSNYGVKVDQFEEGKKTNFKFDKVEYKVVWTGDLLGKKPIKLTTTRSAMHVAGGSNIHDLYESEKDQDGNRVVKRDTEKNLIRRTRRKREQHDLVQLFTISGVSSNIPGGVLIKTPTITTTTDNFFADGEKTLAHIMTPAEITKSADSPIVLCEHVITRNFMNFLSRHPGQTPDNQGEYFVENKTNDTVMVEAAGDRKCAVIHFHNTRKNDKGIKVHGPEDQITGPDQTTNKLSTHFTMDRKVFEADLRVALGSMRRHMAFSDCTTPKMSFEFNSVHGDRLTEELRKNRHFSATLTFWYKNMENPEIDYDEA